MLQIKPLFSTKQDRKPMLYPTELWAQLSMACKPVSPAQTVYQFPPRRCRVKIIEKSNVNGRQTPVLESRIAEKYFIAGMGRFC
jgi:hypothetical protein